jgi:outer membrane protein assembly factor BamA
MFPPHSFTGTRTLWGTYEHRWFTETVLFNLLSVGYAGFFDFGGAWYPEQESRWGGNVGAGIRLGTNFTAAVGMLRLDIGYMFGDGVDETGESDRGLVFGMGTAFVY